jgi:hypothetical protein
MDIIQNRAQPGHQVRGRTVTDAAGVIRRARLRDDERALVLEYIESAVTAQHRGDDLGGARYLIRAAEADNLGCLSDRLGPVLTAVAARFVHP